MDELAEGPYMETAVYKVPCLEPCANVNLFELLQIYIVLFPRDSHDGQKCKRPHYFSVSHAQR